MRALVFHSSNNVKVDTVPDPIIQEADDVILKVTATAICGSDLHLYRGKVPGMKEGDILGHEFMGEVVDAGPGVTELAIGDRWSTHSSSLAVIVFSATCIYFPPARQPTPIVERS